MLEKISDHVLDPIRADLLREEMICFLIELIFFCQRLVEENSLLRLRKLF